MTPLERFHRRAAAHLAGLPPPEAEVWIDRHGLLSLARRPELPETLRSALRRRRRQSLAANLRRIRRFQQIVDALGEMPVCPLKGIHLLGTVYAREPESRPMTDLDLLVRQRDVGAAVGRLASALGLVETAVSAAVAEVAPERCLTGDGTVVEVHDRLGIKHGWASTWEDLEPRPASLHGRGVHLLDAETTLVHLVSHFVKHGPFTRLIWVEDLLRWAGEGIDGARVAARARRLGARRSLLAGVRALRRLAGEDLLPGLAAGADPFVRLNELLVWRLGAPRSLAAGRRGSPLSRNLSACLLADGPGDLLRFLRAKTAELRRRRQASPREKKETIDDCA